MKDPGDQPKKQNAAQGAMDRALRKFETKHTDLIDALARAGHRPGIRLSWPGGDGTGISVWLKCENCGLRRRRWVPEKWKRLSPDQPCSSPTIELR